MLDAIHANFEERLNSFQCDTFASEAVLTVGISLHIYGFFIEKLPKT